MRCLASGFLKDSPHNPNPLINSKPPLFKEALIKMMICILLLYICIQIYIHMVIHKSMCTFVTHDLLLYVNYFI